MSPKDIRALKRWILRWNTGIRDHALFLDGITYYKAALQADEFVFLYPFRDQRVDGSYLKVKLPLSVDNFLDALVQDVQEKLDCR